MRLLFVCQRHWVIQEPDLSFVTGTMDALAPYLRVGQLIFSSTTYPGTTEEEIVSRVEG